MSRAFPPPILSDLSHSSASHFLSLLAHISKENQTLVLGAGVPASSGLPSWKELLSRIASTFFTHWDFEIEHGRTSKLRPPENLSVVFWEDFTWSDRAEEISKRLVGEEDAIRVAQMVKDRTRPIDWIWLVRKALYQSKPPPPLSALLKTIAEFCHHLGSTASILNYNYDDLVEMALLDRGVLYSSVWKPETRRFPNRVPIYYPHGYLKHGGGPVSSIVLGEEDYNEYTVDQYGWRNTIQLQHFLGNVCIFIGVSLSDNHTRRLLWVAKQNGGVKHFAFMPAVKQGDENGAMLEALKDTQLREINVNVIRYPLGPDGNDHRRLPELLSLLTTAIDDHSSIWGSIQNKKL